MNQTDQRDWKGTTRGGTFGYRFFILLIRLSGVKAAYAFLCLVVIYFIPFAPKATQSIWLYGRKILGYGIFRTIKLLFRNYYCFGQTLIDKVAVRSGITKGYRFDFGEEYKNFLDILNSEQGVIMIGAHVGNWEVGASFFNEYGKKMNIVMYDSEYQRIKEILAREMQERNYKILPVNEDGITSLLQIKNALDAHEYVCFQGDRYLPGSQTIQIPFMGYETSFPAGPYLLASRLKVPVVFFFALREKGMRYSFKFILPGQKETTSAKSLLEKYTDTLETIIAQYPEQWFNYYNFWKLK